MIIGTGSYVSTHGDVVELSGGTFILIEGDPFYRGTCSITNTIKAIAKCTGTLDLVVRISEAVKGISKGIDP